MKQWKFSEEQLAYALRQAKGGTPVSDAKSTQSGILHLDRVRVRGFGRCTGEPPAGRLERA